MTPASTSGDGRARRAGGRFASACLGLVLLLPAPAVTGVTTAESSLLDAGPLPVRDRFVLSLGLLAFEPSSPDVLGQGSWRVGATASLFNSWSQSDTVRRNLEARTSRGDLTLDELNAIPPAFAGEGLYHADGQIQSVEVSVHRGLSRGVEIWLRAALIDTAGGFSDGFVEEFHEGLGLSGANRDFLLQNEYTAYLRSPDGRFLYRRSSSGVEIGDLALGARKRLPGGGDLWTHSVETALGVPTGSEAELAGSDSIDVGLRYLGEIDLRRTRLRGAVAVVHHGSNDTVFQKSETLLSFWGGLEHALGPRTSFLIQTSIGQSRYKDSAIHRLGDRIFVADLGLKRRLETKGYLFAALTQNLNRGSSSDFGLHISWQRRF